MVRSVPALRADVRAGQPAAPGHRVRQGDTEAEPALAAALQIFSIPTLMAFRDGVLVYAQPGVLPASALNQVITAVRQLDMDQVRSRIAESAARG